MTKSGVLVTGVLVTLFCGPLLFAQEVKEPITINGDNVEYSADNKEVSASGNVSIVYKGAKLTCKKLVINTETKDADASGNVRLEDEKGIIEGERVKYNFQKKTGLIFDANFRSSPYFGKAKEVDKISEAEFISRYGYMTTCAYDHPHYRMKAKKIDFFPTDKVLIKNVSVYAGQYKQVPLAYLPKYSQSLKDPFMHVQLMPGKKKDWGYYMLSAWRYNLTDDISGRIYFDYREKLGVAEGFGANYKTQTFGKGDFKYYYTQERPRDILEGLPAEFERYFIRWRHKWDIDNQTNLVSEYYKITDSKRALLGSNYSVLKDYFPREYEKDAQPLSYTQLHRSFNYSSVDLLVQKRVNRWYEQLEKLPEVKYSLPSIQLGETPVYFENSTQAASFNKKKPVPSPSTDDVSLFRLDMSNKFSLPMKVAFVSFTPFVRSEQTYYDKNIYGASTVLRSVFYSGADMSTKFYRIFNLNSNFLGMQINGLRHIITPSIGYSFNHEPSVLSSKLKQMGDGIDSISRANSASLELSNKLQTKRKEQTLDLVDFRVSSSYAFKPKTETGKRGSNLSDFLFNLKLLPYSWLTVNADTTYTRSGSRSAPNYNHFSNANYDINFDFGKERSIGLGQRYQRKGGKEMTLSSAWRLSPKWKAGIYERYEFAKTTNIKHGLREFQYTVSRDLHCWTAEVSYSEERGKGSSIWLIFRLKAFPELEFNLNKSYNAPKPGSQ